MKSKAWGWCAAAVFGTVLTASAQTTGTGSQPSGKPATDASGKVTITGCLQADQNGSMFWLSDAGTSTSTPSTSGTTGSVEEKKATAMKETYRLNPTGDVSLKPHVGHKVQITGTMAAGRSGASATSGTSGTKPDAPASGTGAAMKDLEKARQIDVTAVKHISPTCEPGKQ